MPDLVHTTECAKEEALSCVRCSLSETRAQVVWGSGPANAMVVFVGEAPGKNEDLGGKPFIGAAGKILDEFLLSAGLSRDNIYITNVVKCRPPKNRNPLAEEIAACSDYLTVQLDLIKPVIVVALGRFAAQTLLDADCKVDVPMKDIQGTVFQLEQFKLLPVYHPAATLYNPKMKEPFFAAAIILKQALVTSCHSECSAQHVVEGSLDSERT